MRCSVMLCYAMLRDAMLCDVGWCYVMSGDAMRYQVMLCYAISGDASHGDAMPYAMCCMICYVLYDMLCDV